MFDVSNFLIKVFSKAQSSDKGPLVPLHVGVHSNRVFPREDVKTSMLLVKRFIPDKNVSG